MFRSAVGIACLLCLTSGCSDEAAAPLGPVMTPPAAASGGATSSGMTSAVPPSPAATSLPAVEEARKRSEVRGDEVVVLFPALAHRTKEGDWRAELHGWIYEPEADSLARTAVVDELRDSLQIPAGDPGSVHFRRRTALFLVDNEGDKRISVRVADSVHALSASGDNGHFQGEIRISSEAAERAHRKGHLFVEALLRPDDKRRFVGRVHLVEPSGVLVISDIDDTIKITNVRDRAELLRRTFLLELEPVPDLAPVYRRWLGDSGHLHFVSSSPWQLYGELALMAEQAGFPPATYSLKSVRLKDSSIMSLFTDPVLTKPMDIVPILESYPQRRIMLVGDSGEKDPEIYGSIYRDHPKRISRIVIRDVTGEARDAKRYLDAFKDVPDDRWTLFTKPEDLK